MQLTPEEQGRFNYITKTLDEFAKKLLQAPPQTNWELANLVDEYGVKLLSVTKNAA